MEEARAVAVAVAAEAHFKYENGGSSMRVPVEIIAAIAVVVILILVVMSTYNSLVVKRNRVQNAWSQIDVQLKRRFDLIPNLIETVKGYASHESKTLETVTAARTKYMSAGSHQDAMEANDALSQSLGRLFAVAEAYPDLKANTSFVSLQNELTNTEDKIGFSRQFYNDTAMTFNNAVQMFPSNIIAGIFGFKPEPFFRATEAETSVPEVKF